MRDAHAEPAAPRVHVADDLLDQPEGVPAAALPRGQQHRPEVGYAGRRRLLDRGELADERGSRGQLAGMQVHRDLLAERERQQGERAGRPGQLNLPDGQLAPALIVPDVHGAAGRREQPPKLLVARHVAVAEHADRMLQRGCPGLIPVGD